MTLARAHVRTLPASRRERVSASIRIRSDHGGHSTSGRMPNGSGVWEPGEEGQTGHSRRGGVAVESLDPDSNLPVVDEAGAWIERELSAGIGLRTGVVWRRERSPFARQNANQPFDAFTVPVDDSRSRDGWDGGHGGRRRDTGRLRSAGPMVCRRKHRAQRPRPAAITGRGKSSAKRRSARTVVARRWHSPTRGMAIRRRDIPDRRFATTRIR